MCIARADSAAGAGAVAVPLPFVVTQLRRRAADGGTGVRDRATTGASGGALQASHGARLRPAGDPPSWRQAPGALALPSQDSTLAISQEQLVAACGLTSAVCSHCGAGEQVRCGNLGHISRLGNKIAELAGSGEGALAEYCAGHSGWQEWVESGLSERNAVESLTSWQCGRPRELDDSANDSDGDDDVLRGGFGMGGGFGSGGELGWDNSAWRVETEESSDAYHRYSGDDKEEEEEEEEDGEEEGEEEEGDIDSMKVLESFNFQASFSPSPSPPFHFQSTLLQRQEEDGGGSSSDESFEATSTAAAGGSTLPLGAVGAPADAEEDAVLMESDDDDEMVDASTVQQLSEKLTKATLDDGPEPSEEEVAPEFNQFNYWKTNFMMDIPDDV